MRALNLKTDHLYKIEYDLDKYFLDGISPKPEKITLDAMSRYFVVSKPKDAIEEAYRCCRLGFIKWRIRKEIDDAEIHFKNAVKHYLSASEPPWCAIQFYEENGRYHELSSLLTKTVQSVSGKNKKIISAKNLRIDKLIIKNKQDEDQQICPLYYAVHGYTPLDQIYQQDSKSIRVFHGWERLQLRLLVGIQDKSPKNCEVRVNDPSDWFRGCSVKVYGMGDGDPIINVSLGVPLKILRRSSLSSHEGDPSVLPHGGYLSAAPSIELVNRKGQPLPPGRYRIDVSCDKNEHLRPTLSPIPFPNLLATAGSFRTCRAAWEDRRLV